MASIRARTPVKAPRRIARRLRIENQVAWLARHRRVQLHVAPTGSSWLTQGELGGYLWARSLYNRIPTR